MERLLCLFAMIVVGWVVVISLASVIIFRVFRKRQVSSIAGDYPKNGTYEAWLNAARESLSRSKERRNGK